MAYQAKDVLMAMEKDSGIKIRCLNVDGGASSNNFLLLFQSDILVLKVNRPQNIESTAFGAALLAGLSSKFWTIDQIKENKTLGQSFNPAMDSLKVKTLYYGWLKAVEVSRKWSM